MDERLHHGHTLGNGLIGGVDVGPKGMLHHGEFAMQAGQYGDKHAGVKGFVGAGGIALECGGEGRLQNNPLDVEA